MTSIGDRIREARERLGLTQKQLAKSAKISQSTIAAAESDPNRKPRDLNSIAAALGVDPYELEFGKRREGTPPPDPSLFSSQEINARALLPPLSPAKRRLLEAVSNATAVLTDEQATAFALVFEEQIKQVARSGNGPDSTSPGKRI